MRKLIYAINLTIDGCCDHTKGIPNEEVHEFYTNMLRDTGLLLYGRITYQLMVPFWPDMAKNHSGQTKAMNDFAQIFTAIDKVVVSGTYNGSEATIIRTNLQEEIQKLKQAPGKDILTGGVDLPSQLIQLGLVDEYRIVVHPAFAGEGRRLLTDIRMEQLPVKLVESISFKSGHVALRYTV
jgi:Dihydrofolate reductase